MLSNNEALDKSLAALNMHRPLLDNLTPFVFHNGERLPAPANIEAGWALFMIHRPLRQQQIIANDLLTSLPFGRIYPLYCAGLNLGYLAEFPPQIVSVQPKMLTAVRRKATRQTLFTDVAMLFKNQHLTVFASNDDAILIMANKFDILAQRSE